MNLPPSTWIAEPPRAAPADAIPEGPDSPRIKILHVITKFTTGAGGNTLHSATGMDAQRYDVWVAAGPGGECFAPARRAGVTTVEVPRLVETIRPLDDLLAYRALVRVMRRERFAIVHTHTAKAGLIARLAARRCRVPVVIHTFHAFPFHDHMSRVRRRFYLTLDRFARRFTNAFVAVAPQVARDAIENRIAPPGTVVVIPSSVDLDATPSGRDRAFRDEIGIADDVPLVGTVGRITFQKAPLTFVRAAAAVAGRRPDARFVVVGDGPMEADARAEADRLGVTILFTGFRPDAEAITASFDVFVMPSLYEGLGRSLTEALASGRPVVASAVNGVSDLVRPGATGLLSRPGNADSVAECILWMLEHPIEARRMGMHGRTAVRSLFSQQSMCDSLDHVYRTLLGLPTQTVALPSVRLSEPQTNGRSPRERAHTV